MPATHLYKLLLGFFLLLHTGILYGQNVDIPGTPVIHTPTPVSLYNVPINSIAPSNSKQNTKTQTPATLDFGQQRQQQQILNEVNRNEKLREQTMQSVESDIEELRSSVQYDLPSLSNMPGAEFYIQAFEKIVSMDTLGSIAEKNFLIENAYYDNKLDKKQFDALIENCRLLIVGKMKEKGYDAKSNTAKNLILFQFFNEPMQLKNSKNKHLPFKYDFDDYTGAKDYSKMFVTKLLSTGTGQCHSMPLLYLILAEKIGAEAYLALSPNHSYIRFPDDSGKWYNIELTNGMFSTTSYILQSGYIKSEALQNKIYMQILLKKELLAQHLTDLATGYIKKFGYDEFVQKVIDKALSLYPNSINAHMIKANLDTARFEYVMRALKINPRDPKDLQQIRDYPQAVALLNAVNAQYDTVDSLGYEPMPEDAYQQWLQAMNKNDQKQENEKISNQIRTTLPHKKN